MTTDSAILWSYKVPHDVFGLPDLIVVDISHKGDVIIAAVLLAAKVRIYYFSEANTTDPVMKIFDFNSTMIRATAISGDGNIISAILASNIVVLEAPSGIIRYGATFEFSTSDFCMSRDGTYMAYVSDYIIFLHWNGTGYDYSFDNFDNDNFTGGACAISDNDILALGWYRNDLKQNALGVYQLNQNSNPTELWTNFLPVDTGVYENVVTSVAITPQAEVIAMGAWGDGETASTVVVYQGDDGKNPLFTYTTPGSMNDVDVTISNGMAFVSAVGKHVHISIEDEQGGDAFMFAIVLV